MATSLLSPLAPPAGKPVPALDRAQRLCHQAQAVVDVSKDLVRQSHRRRFEWQQWRTIWSEYSRSPWHFITCCAYCARIRSVNGDWVSIPATSSRALHKSRKLYLSHGCCDDCLRRHFPAGVVSRVGSHHGAKAAAG